MENKNENVFKTAVDQLKVDAFSLSGKISRLQNQGDYRGAIDCMRLLKDTLSLIKEYDWQLMYSEYETNGQKQVAVWEQNNCSSIRNHKIWHIEKQVMYIDFAKDKAIVFINGYEYLLDFKPLAKNGRVPLVDFINSYGKDYEIYVDNRGFGIAITDVLDTYKISYQVIKFDNCLQALYR